MSFAIILSVIVAAGDAVPPVQHASPPSFVNVAALVAEPQAATQAPAIRVGRVSGRPPMPPIFRGDPLLHDVTFEGTLFTEQWENLPDSRRTFSVRDSPIVLPFIGRSTWSQVDLASFNSRLWLDGREDGQAASRSRIEPDRSFGMSFAVLPIAGFTGMNLRFEITYRVQTWASRVDELAASQATWPTGWPEECDDALAPQTFIDSDHPTFAAFVERVTEGRLREVSPYLAAKELIRHTIASVRSTGSGNVFRESGAYAGMDISMASVAADRGSGTRHDVVAVCVAVLRAAGIPARPVVGLEREQVRGTGSPFVTWGEFFLPEAGWVPFDPHRLRNANVARLDVREPWPGLGSIGELNRSVPLAFTFHPPASVVAHDWPAVFGWDPRPQVSRQNARQIIRARANARGPGVPDP